MDTASVTAAITSARFIKDFLEVVIGYKIENESNAKINEALKQAGAVYDTLYTLREELFRLQTENQELQQKLRTQEFEKNQRIEELEEALRSKDSLIKVDDAYYVAGPGGHPSGEPYCMHCWEVTHKKYHLKYTRLIRIEKNICPNCDCKYEVDKTRVI
jgi:hypothetical protein